MSGHPHRRRFLRAAGAAGGDVRTRPTAASSIHVSNLRVTIAGQAVDRTWSA